MISPAVRVFKCTSRLITGTPLSIFKIMTMTKTESWYENTDFPVPENETERLKALARYESLTSAPADESSFKRLATLAAHICSLPISFINLITKEDQFTKSCYGFHGATGPRKASICQFTIMQDDIFEVHDVAAHEVFGNNPYVENELKIGYYVGVPLKTPDGYNIGTLCLIDQRPNAINDMKKHTLRVLAQEIVSQFELKAARARLEQNNKEKDELIRIVSHDMRNPLMGIVGFAEYLQNELENDDQKEIAATIQQAGQSILSIVNTLLDSEYIKKEAFRLNAVKTNIAALTEEVISLVQPFIMLKNQQLNVDLSAQLAWSVDPEKWKQIVGNLLTNASKFTPIKGIINIRAEVDEHGRMLMLEVTDTGRGMDEELLNKLFSGNKSILRIGTEGEASSGIGMPTIKRYVDLHGGNISVTSRPEEGTKVTLRIPEQAA